MDIQYYNYPWKHFIIDDLIPPDLLNELQLLVDDMTIKNKEYHYFSKNSKTYNKLKEALYNVYFETNHLKNIKFDTEQIHLRVDRPTFRYPVHVDNDSKQMSLVLYVSDAGDGTRLYKDPNIQTHEVLWKKGRVVGFYKDTNTWHDYYASKCIRGVVVMNLVCD